MSQRQRAGLSLAELFRSSWRRFVYSYGTIVPAGTRSVLDGIQYVAKSSSVLQPFFGVPALQLERRTYDNSSTHLTRTRRKRQ
eukprot:scaffold36321_cov63-Attheya_sp.AAC.9